jgi:hypothetical protein
MWRGSNLVVQPNIEPVFECQASLGIDQTSEAVPHVADAYERGPLPPLFLPMFKKATFEITHLLHSCNDNTGLKMLGAFQSRAFILALMFAHHSVAVPVVYLPHEKIIYHGKTIGSVEHFQNIKFAHDTSGPRRFAPPFLYLPTRGTKVEASIEGSACPQTRDAMPPFFAETTKMAKMDEHCLNLRIARH